MVVATKCWASCPYSTFMARSPSTVEEATLIFSGLNCLVHQCLYSGLTLVVMSNFSIEKFCFNIQRYNITFAYVVPPVVLLLGKNPAVDEYDLSSLRMLNCGAAPLTRELVETVYKRIKVPVKQGYGLSESSPSTHTQVSQEVILHIAHPIYSSISDPTDFDYQ